MPFRTNFWSRLVGIGVLAVLFQLEFAEFCQAADLDQRIDAEMVWNSTVKANDLTGAISNDPSHITLSDLENRRTDTRVLGLTKLRWELDWRRHKQSGIFIVLRPDSTLKRTSDDDSGVAREFDSRSGSVYRPSSEVHLLDSYYLRATLGEQFSGRVGVYEAIAPVRASYPVTADFSLRVRLPEKYYGAQLDWAVRGDTSPGSVSETFNKFECKLIGFSHDGDRAEEYGQAKGETDQAPSMQNPNIGTAAGLNWRVSDLLNFEMLGGIQTRPGLDSKIREIFFNVVAVQKFSIFNRTGLVISDIRHAQESWLAAPADKLRQSSASVSGSYLLSEATRIVTAVQYGRSERFVDLTREQINLHSGYQLELGVRNQVREGLDWGVLYAHESRLISKDEVGVSSTEAEDTTPGVARRLSVSLNYLIGTSG